MVPWWYQYLPRQLAPAGGTGNIQWSNCSEVSLLSAEFSPWSCWTCWLQRGPGPCWWTADGPGPAPPAGPGWTGCFVVLCSCFAAGSSPAGIIDGDSDWSSASRAASSLIGSPVFTSSPRANGGSGRVPSGAVAEQGCCAAPA